MKRHRPHRYKPTPYTLNHKQLVRSVQLIATLLAIALAAALTYALTTMRFRW